MSVPCAVEEILLPGDFTMVDSVRVTCSRCGCEAESFGTGKPSITRCLAMLHEKCPSGEDNFYVDAAEKKGARSSVSAKETGPMLPKISLGRGRR
jgi:hypothetical protein